MAAPVIFRDDDEWVTQNSHEGRGKGYLPRNWYENPYGSVRCATAFDLPIVPRDEWADRIADMIRTKTMLSDISDQAGIECYDQGSTNYCWINAPCYAAEVIRAAQNQSHVVLSPASVGAKIKNFRNVGGWGSEGLQYIADHGCVPAPLWPANGIDRQYDTPEADAEREKYRIVEWYELRARDFDQLMTCLFHRIPVAVGYNWWGHEVTAIDPAMDTDGTFGIRIRNSWSMTWGDRGYGFLFGRKAVPDDAVAPRVLIPSNN